MKATSKELASRLRKERQKRGLSHAKLKNELENSHGISISIDSLKNYEFECFGSSTKPGDKRAGSNMAMRVEYLSALADFYGVSMDYLLGKTETFSQDAEMEIVKSYTGLNEDAISQLRFDRTRLDVDGDRYMSFLSSLLTDSSFRYLLLELYRFATANEAKTVYDKMKQDFDERKKKGEIEDHSEYTEEILRHAKRTDLHDEVRGMFLVQAKLNNLKSPIIQELAKDTPDANIRDIYMLEAMRAFDDLLDEETGSPCFKKINP